jgi:hypothetical protein
LGGALASHAVAACATIVLLAAVPIIAYAMLVLLGVILYGDPGGPLNFVVVPLMAVAFALLATLLVILPISLLFGALRRRELIPWWAPPFLFFWILMIPCAVTAFVEPGLSMEGRFTYLLFMGAWMALFTLPFIFYWVIHRTGYGGASLVARGVERLLVRLVRAGEGP